MIRTAFAWITFLLGMPVFAQLSPIILTVDPAAEPKPALRYSLLPSGRDRVAGNAALHYTKAVLARPSVDRTKATEEDKKVVAWDDAALDKLPIDDVKAYLKGYAAAFRELEYGSRCKSCEWESAPANGPAALDQIIAAQPAFRDLARMLSLRVRVEMAERRYDDAVGSIRTGLQYAKHLGEGPSMIQMLVGYAVANVFLARLEEFQSCSGAPSLYWALSSLPRPLIDPRPGLDAEDELNESFLPGLSELRRGPVSAEKALDVAEGAMKVFAAVEESSPFASLGGRLAITGNATLHHEAARKDLINRGWDKNAVVAMPAVQAVYLNSFEAYRVLADEHRKWFLAPFPEAFDGLAKANARVKKAQKDGAGDTLFQTFLLVLPAVEKVHQAGARTERRLTLLRVIEAVRIHTDAASAIPKALDEIKKAPVPSDPLTNRPFAFSRTATGFTISSPESESVPKSLEMSYEVKVRK